jgi:hypothetical protein
LRIAKHIEQTQQEYWDIVRACPSLPDIVFTHKTFKQKRIGASQMTKKSPVEVIDLTK